MSISIKIAKVLAQNSSVCVRNVCTTSSRLLDQKWREAEGLTANPNEFGPLTNKPDYSFVDGRPTPLGSNQKKRILKQQEVMKKIVTMSSELKFAKERYAKTQQDKAAAKQRVISDKLKPKGHLLLKKQ